MTGSWVLLPSLSSTTRVQPKDCPHTAQATCRNLEYNGTESNDACPMRQNARASRHTFLFPVPWLFSPRFHPRDVDSRTVENAYSDKLHGQGCRMKFSDEALNPLNLMPDISNAPTHGLSTSRVESSIPKTGGDKTWVYPSASQLYRALERRGKWTEARDVPAVLFVHNLVNEETWKKIRHLEDMHHSECSSVSLTRFCGKSEEHSLSARIHYLFTRERPFDRHDWFIDRCGKEVRYIIDYYHQESSKDTPQENTASSLTVRSDGKQIPERDLARELAEVYIYARPAAFDSLGNFMDFMRQHIEAFVNFRWP